MPMQNSINAHPDCRMLCTCTRSWSEPSREVWNVSYDGICVDCARKGAFADISFFHFFSPLRFSFRSPAQIHLPCPQQPFEAVLPFLKQITEFLEKLLTWPRSKFSYGSVNLELRSCGALYILHLFICCTVPSSFPSHLRALLSPCPPFNPFQPAERPSPTAASRSLLPCKFGSDKQSCLQSVWSCTLKKIESDEKSRNPCCWRTLYYYT